MFNVLKSEFLKLKKDTMFYIGTIITMLVPVLVILKDKVISASPKSAMDWVMTCCLVDFIYIKWTCYYKFGSKGVSIRDFNQYTYFCCFKDIICILQISHLVFLVLYITGIYRNRNCVRK